MKNIINVFLGYQIFRMQTHIFFRLILKLSSVRVFFFFIKLEKRGYIRLNLQTCWFNLFSLFCLCIVNNSYWNSQHIKHHLRNWGSQQVQFLLRQFHSLYSVQKKLLNVEFCKRSPHYLLYLVRLYIEAIVREKKKKNILAVFYFSVGWDSHFSHSRLNTNTHTYSMISQ